MLVVVVAHHRFHGLDAGDGLLQRSEQAVPLVPGPVARAVPAGREGSEGRAEGRGWAESGRARTVR